MPPRDMKLQSLLATVEQLVHLDENDATDKAKKSLEDFITRCWGVLHCLCANEGKYWPDVTDKGGIDFVICIGKRRLVIPIKEDGRVLPPIVSGMGSSSDGSVHPSTLDLLEWVLRLG